jgi:electron transfer flavoprotein alpha subunit
MSENKILVFIDQFKGEALPASWEALGAGQFLAEKMGTGVAVLVAGPHAQSLAEQAYQYGAQQAFYADDETLADYRPEPYAALIAKVAGELDPDVLLLPTTMRGRELAAMAAIDLDSGVLADVTELEVQDGEVIATRPIYAGKLLSKAVCEAKPRIITTRGRAFSKPEQDPSQTGTPTQVEAAMTADEIPSQVVEYSESEGGVSLTDAAVVVSGGRGVAMNPNLTPPSDLDEKEAEIWKAQQGFELVGELADVLGGAVGASRAAVDAGYIPYPHQVGQTGKVVTPDLYIAIGISGAIQHLAGMRNSKMIVAINKDPDAPIFKLARFGVVGDLYSVLPPLIEAFRERLGK